MTSGRSRTGHLVVAGLSAAALTLPAYGDGLAEAAVTPAPPLTPKGLDVGKISFTPVTIPRLGGDVQPFTPVTIPRLGGKVEPFTPVTIPRLGGDVQPFTPVTIPRLGPGEAPGAPVPPSEGGPGCRPLCELNVARAQPPA